MLQRILMMLLLITAVNKPALFAQKSMSGNYTSHWNKADSLLSAGFPQSAKSIIEQILLNAEKNEETVHIVKAQLYLLEIVARTSDQGSSEAIIQAAAKAKSSQGIVKAIWQSITAEFYWNYFQSNRYKFYNRTQVEDTKDEDIETWDAATLFKNTGSLFLSSIEDANLLKATRIENYHPLLEEGVNTRELRPTVYDLLAFRALNFFQNEERTILRAADKFEMEGAYWFDDAPRFSELKPKVKSGDDFHFKALRIYQELLRFHLNDKNPSALIDADLHRLSFVHTYSVHPDKDSLYQTALRQLEQRYENFPASAQISFLLAETALASASADNGSLPKIRQPQSSGKKLSNIPAVSDKLRAIIKKYPTTEGAMNARNLLSTLEQASIDIQTEEVTLPGEEVKVLLSYKNAAKVSLKLYRMPFVPLGSLNQHTDSLREYLRNMPVLKSWEQNLTGSEDMQQHSTEIAAGKWEKGNYLIVASINRGDAADDPIVVASGFQVSFISLISNQADGSALVLHRDNGKPFEGIKATYWRRQYDNKKHKYVFQKSGSASSDNKGRLNLPKTAAGGYQNQIAAITLQNNGDTLQIEGNFYGHDNETAGNKTTQHSFIFTDRSLYRPGQTIYFKGIVLESRNSERIQNVLKNKSMTLSLFDANGQKVSSIQLVTNNFGSYQGQFIAPEGLLNGIMRLGDNFGSTYINVEEYKRPKFEVRFDTLRNNYGLNEEVQIKGFATAYAGNHIDGATVQYRVMRQARFPYFWRYQNWGMPSAAAAEISSGITTTDAEGSFSVTFSTQPDRSIDPDLLPVFTFTVYADITDLNGETRSGSFNLQCGYHSLQISAAIPEESDPNILRSIKVRTENLNGIFTSAPLQLKVYRLKFPGLFRKRLWDIPDQYVLDQPTFRKLFPNDEYRDESNYMSWEKSEAVYEYAFTSNEKESISIPGETWKANGWYLIEIRGKDKLGKEVIEKKYTHVWSPEGRGDPQKSIIAYTNRAVYEPGQNLKLWLRTAWKNPVIFTQANPADVPKTFDGAQPTYFTVQEQHRGGIAYSWMYIHNNRMYTLQRTIQVPWSNKQLQLEWASHREVLYPGTAETWTLTIRGNKKEQVAAEMVAGMYDASLDAFKPHSWRFNSFQPQLYAYNRWNAHGFGIAQRIWLHTDYNHTYEYYQKQYDALRVPNIFYGDVDRRLYTGALSKRSKVQNADRMEENESPGNMSTIRFTAPVIAAETETPTDSQADGGNTQMDNRTPTTIRTNFSETAFFFPQLATDKDGNISFRFQMPEALTEWKMMAFAHSENWSTAYLEGKVKTQKDLMVVPNLPRFLRQNDQQKITAKINNLSDSVLNGAGTLEILDALTLQPLNVPFRVTNKEPGFTIKPGQSSVIHWDIHVPESIYTPVVIRISARTEGFSDGEEHVIPVVSNRTLVTETLPLHVQGNETRHFRLEGLLNSVSATAVNHALTVNFTGNPAWYAVQALPYLMEYPYECAEQTFNRLYANTVAGFVVAQSPKIESIFKQWQLKDTAALVSNLMKNEELKSALLEETPWVLAAQSETEQKRRIALLFETTKLARELEQSLKKLEKMQLSNGAFPWFTGMKDDRYITQYIATGLGRLQKLDSRYGKAAAFYSLGKKCLRYLDEQLVKDYKELQQRKVNIDQKQIGYLQIQYLYMRSFWTSEAPSAATQQALQYYQSQAKRYWSDFNPYLKGQIAAALNRNNEKATAQLIIASLKESAILHPEMGMYWKNMPKGYYWYEAPIEAQALLIEAFQEVAGDLPSAEAMKIWLLKQKQTQHWQTTKATADAIYALLLQGSNWLDSEPVVRIQLGNEILDGTNTGRQAGTGYFEKKYKGSDVRSEMGNIKVSVQHGTTNSQQIAWGGVYWQYFEDMEKIKFAATPLSIEKRLFIERNSDQGPQLTELSEENRVKVGDKVIVRVIIRSDRDMEYVHLKDMRASCFEPLNVLSQYKYQGGLGYYESTRDLSTNFFFNYLRKGTYVFEYPLRAQSAGNFSNGISTIQCMYAPEFSSHSEGLRIQVD
jgi:uncharacterized protein YfaS (alpha-2-macroglobulin family)